MPGGRVGTTLVWGEARAVQLDRPLRGVLSRPSGAVAELAGMVSGCAIGQTCSCCAGARFAEEGVMRGDWEGEAVVPAVAGVRNWTDLFARRREEAAGNGNWWGSGSRGRQKSQF